MLKKKLLTELLECKICKSNLQPKRKLLLFRKILKLEFSLFIQSTSCII